jgi:hypothetical protein
VAGLSAERLAAGTAAALDEDRSPLAPLARPFGPAINQQRATLTRSGAADKTQKMIVSLPTALGSQIRDYQSRRPAGGQAHIHPDPGAPAMAAGDTSPRPVRTALTKRAAWWEALVSAIRRALPNRPKSEKRSAAAPRLARLVHIWSTVHRSRAVPSGLQRYIVYAGRRGPTLGKQVRVQNPEKDEFIQEAPWSVSVAKTLPRVASQQPRPPQQ